MAGRAQPVDAAFDRVAVLRAIVGAERRRAEGDPFSQRNLDLGITEAGQPRDNARARVVALFNDLELLLGHLAIMHMAAAFEAEVATRLPTVIGAARKAVEDGRKREDRWPANLVRSADSFKGLHDIADVLSLRPSLHAAMATIRHSRNLFSHGVPLNRVPPLTAEEVREVLNEVLAKLR